MLQDALQEAFAGKRRWCYYILETQRDEHGFIPSIVVEDSQGHYPMRGAEGGAPWYWGKTLEAAERTCAAQNANKGLTKRDVFEIMSSSMFGARGASA